MKKIDQTTINWLLEGDVAIQYQVHRDLLKSSKKALQSLQNRIANEGWGAALLSKQKPDGHWGLSFYQPKWTSSHYTLLELKNLAISPDTEQINKSITTILANEKEKDGGINPAGSVKVSDVCINGMFLNYACYFKAKEKELESIVDFILSQKMRDGGFNCRFNRSGARHSSLHSTISVLEGINEYEKNRYKYRLPELLEAANSSHEFILMHQLYISDRTGKIIHPNFTKIPYPSRWRYDILRALDYFQYASVDYDTRMEAALTTLKNKQKRDGYWPLQAHHPGARHITMERAGQPSRWNTLRALRVLQKYDKKNNQE